jgi:hypothetical protein
LSQQHADRRLARAEELNGKLRVDPPSREHPSHEATARQGYGATC